MAKTLEDMTVPELLEHTRKLEKDNSLLTTLSSDPETRRDLLRLAKKKMPNTPIPEIDNTLEAERIVAVERERGDKLEARLLNIEIGQRIEAEEKKLRDKYEFTDEDVQEVRKLMIDKDAPIPNFEGAAKVYRASRMQAEPSSAAITIADKTWEMPDKNLWAKGVGDKMALNKAFTQQAYAAVAEARGGKKAA